MKKGRYIAVDQWSNVHYGLEHPRKDLMHKLGYQSANKMYVDHKDGNTYHIGYVIGPFWCRLFTPVMERES